MLWEILFFFKMGRSKKRRIGSDDYTLDLEKRVLETERSIAELTKIFNETLKEKDEKIANLEAEIADLRGVKNGGIVLDNVCVGVSDDGVDTVTNEKEVTEHDLLIIGASIVDSVDPVASNPNGGSTVVCVRGGSPRDILEMYRKTLQTKKFKRVIVHAGTNLIPIFSKEYVADNLIETMFDIKKLSPDSKIAFSCILPKFNDSWLPEIDYINSRVARAGYSVPDRLRFGFCNHLARFVGPRGTVNPAYFRKDGIHLSNKGSELFNRSLKLLIDI